MMIPNKNPLPPAGRSGGIQRKDGDYYNRNNYTVNPYYSSHEKVLLVRMLMRGKCFRHEFVDSRHRFIYSWLESFLLNFPVNQHAPDWFLCYLSETPWAIERAGGKSYIMDIFRGLGGCK
ncbi:hypothetical protein AGMMS49944_09420 [Spirochaetia bacterium]|nr:hypothetical protein AGMMS49944_09420 [Spirochaetia bacterium]